MCFGLLISIPFSLIPLLLFLQHTRTHVVSCSLSMPVFLFGGLVCLTCRLSHAAMVDKLQWSTLSCTLPSLLSQRLLTQFWCELRPCHDFGLVEERVLTWTRENYVPMAHENIWEIPVWDGKLKPSTLTCRKEIGVSRTRWSSTGRGCTGQISTAKTGLGSSSRRVWRPGGSRATAAEHSGRTCAGFWTLRRALEVSRGHVALVTRASQKCQSGLAVSQEDGSGLDGACRSGSSLGH